MTRRLVISYLLVSLVVLLILEIPLALFYYQLERERFTATSERDAVILATYYRDAVGSSSQIDPKPALDYAAGTGSRVIVVDNRGTSVLDTVQEPGVSFLVREEIQTALAGQLSADFQDDETNGNEVLHVGVPIASGGEVEGALQLGVDAEAVNSRIRRFWGGLLAIAILILAALALVGLTVARSATRPIKQLQASAARFGQGDFSQLEPPGEEVPDEIRQLAQSMNLMGRQLEQLIGRQRSFVADASHQLRTPLTALRLRLENLEAGFSPGGSVKAEIEAAIDETVRLSNLVHDLLHLARDDSQPRIVPVDLGALAIERVGIWQAMAEGNAELLVDVPPGPIKAFAVEGAVEQVLDNLIDNSLHATPDDRRIMVRLEQGQAQHRLTVVDEGPGLTDDQKARATERFWRGDHHRSGSGLGLAVVANLVDASSGQLMLEDNPWGSGLQVSTYWPSDNVSFEEVRNSTMRLVRRSL